MPDLSNGHQTTPDIRNVEKRIDDLKWYIGIFSGAIAVLFAGLAVIVGLNLSAERSSLKEYKDSLREEIREALGASAARPLIELQTSEREPLNGAIIPARVWVDSEGTRKISFRYVVRNEGKGRSGPMFVKMYSSDLRLPNREIDGTGFKYEEFIKPENFTPAELFGGVSMEYTFNIAISEDPSSKELPKTMLVVYFYANGQRTEAKLKLQIQEEQK